MNLTSIGSIPGTSNWKRNIKGQYVAAAAGMALALSAVFAVGHTGRGESIGARANVTVPVQRQVSQADIDASVLSTEMATFELSPAAVQRQASQTDIDASVLSTEMSVYDFSAATIQQRVASEADIAASVLSTELANFGN